MEAICLKFDNQEVQAQAKLSITENEKTIFLQYEADNNEKVQAYLYKDDSGWLIREHSINRELYLSLSEVREEGYLKTKFGMIIFETKLLSVNATETSLTLNYQLIQNGEVEQKHLVLQQN